MRYSANILFYHVFHPLSNVSAFYRYPLSHFLWLLVKYLKLIIFLLLFVGNLEAVPLVSTSPALTELLYQLGKGKDLTATSDLSDYPEEAKGLPRIGSLFSPSIEKTLAFEPKWVVLDAATLNPHFAQALTALRIPTVTLAIHSADSLFAESRKFLKQVYQETDSDILKKEEQALEIQKKKRKTQFRYLAFTWHEPPILIGHHTLLSDLFSIVGGENILPDYVRLPYPQVSVEWLMKEKPDVVYFLQQGADTSASYQSIVEKWWPQQTPKLIALKAEQFARTSLTPLKNIDQLRVQK